MSSRKKKTKAGSSAKSAYISPKYGKALTGSRNPAVITVLLRQLDLVLCPPVYTSAADERRRVRAAVATLKSIAPADEIEGMLAGQIIGTNHLVMNSLQMASSLQEWNEPGRERNIKNAVSLMSIFNKQVELLDRRRGRGQQKITVEHVNVHSGGQAIVGNVGMQERPALAASETPTLTHQEGMAECRSEMEPELVRSKGKKGDA